MTPATSAGASPETRTGRPARWTREEIIEAIREWTALYGEPPRAADWNPSSARWSAATWRIARYRKGRPDGTPWPSLNRAKAPFDGSLKAALTAAGFEPNKPGPKTRRDVTPQLLERTEMPPAVRAELAAASSRLERAQATITTLREERRELHAERDAALRDAERRAAVAERRYAELAAAATGKPRRLTPGELAGLRTDGPAGPGLIGEALRALAAARKTNNPQLVGRALGELAAAAVTWRERL